jgi:pyridoxal phosphate enzyme (YggS family)
LSISENIYEIKKDLAEGKTLIAVSKYKDIPLIKEAYDCGIRDFGESRVQELEDKIDKLPEDIKWHLIGHLQRNKVKYIVGKVSLIHSLDSTRLLDEIDKQYGSKGLTAEVLIEINIGREESKAGVLLENLESILGACEGCSNVKVKGLMAIIPKGDEESSRSYFKQMKKLWEDLGKRPYSNICMEYLSMGMTEDYKIAISEGSNMVRIGTGIFGKR